MIRLPAGARPVHVKLTPFEEFSWRFMGAAAKARAPDPQLEEDLLRGHMRIRPEEYLAYVYTSTVVTVIASLIFAGILSTLVILRGLPLLFLALLPPAAIILPPLMAFGYLRGAPKGRAKDRARRIDKKITSSMNFISAMASAEVPVDLIFRELAKQKIYGEVAAEAEWITRDTELLGVDILNAIKNGAKRTPSVKMQDFLQGVVTTSTSGGQLKPYFLVKAEQFEREDKLEMRKRMETLGLLAESFVTVVVAFPLFLVVIMAIMALISKASAGFIVTMLFAVVGLMIPFSQFGFIFVIWNQEQEN